MLAAAGQGDTEVAAEFSMSARTRQRERSLTVTFSITFLAFLVCFLPWSLLSLADPWPGGPGLPPSGYAG